jgi:hypothetical protein
MKPIGVSVSLIPTAEGVLVWGARFHLEGTFDLGGATLEESATKRRALEKRIARAIGDLSL